MRRYEYIHDSIDVWVQFEKQKPQIRAFAWKNKLYKITSLNLITKASNGTVPVHLFSVSNNKGAFKIRLDTDTLSWWLEEIYWED